jgi:hypothetical protein
VKQEISVTVCSLKKKKRRKWINLVVVKDVEKNSQKQNCACALVAKVSDIAAQSFTTRIGMKTKHIAEELLNNLQLSKRRLKIMNQLDGSNRIESNRFFDQ